MTIQILNTRKAQAAIGIPVATGLVVFGLVEGILGLVHANHTMHVHQGQNITYRLTDCSESPGGSGSQWDASILVHNTNPDGLDDYGVQVEFLDPAGVPQAWTSIKHFGADLDPNSTKTLHLHATTDQPGSPQVTCKLVFYRGNSKAGDTSPVPMG